MLEALSKPSHAKCRMNGIEWKNEFHSETKWRWNTRCSKNFVALIRNKGRLPWRVIKLMLLLLSLSLSLLCHCLFTHFFPLSSAAYIEILGFVCPNRMNENTSLHAPLLYASTIFIWTLAEQWFWRCGVYN